MMSTASGFVVGVLTVATLTVVYGQKLTGSLRQALDQYQPVVQQPPLIAAKAVALVAATVTPVRPEPTLEQRWAVFAAQAATAEPAGDFPWRECFARAAASYDLPEALLLAIASGESNFDAAARSAKDAVGLMQIRWPDTSRHLGVSREADLYDPCTNVDAGARYLVELAAQFDNNLHLMVAAYNYGPGRINAGELPEGARWYSQYIYRHLQQVLGGEPDERGELSPPTSPAAVKYQVLMRFDSPRRARDFMSFITLALPGLTLQQRSEALGQHDVVLLYEDEAQRLRALSLINATGIVIGQSQSTSKQTL